ncbi:hypothetical protein [Brevundimonas nasdae]|uniref:hypothetical protein n=1 Tax=Brevundimonas nasdae TaxID=172043 RepID=UPI003F68F61E
MREAQADFLVGLDEGDWSWSRSSMAGIPRKPGRLASQVMYDGAATVYADVEFGEAEALARVERAA